MGGSGERWLLGQREDNTGQLVDSVGNAATTHDLFPTLECTKRFGRVVGRLLPSRGGAAARAA
jgi:hypothetical protein